MSILIKNISKSFENNQIFRKKRKVILEDINAKINKSDVIGLIGPNGSGKTTFIKIILGLIEPDKGKVEICDGSKKYLAYVNTNSRSFFWRISARENLVFFGKLLNLSDEEIDNSIEELAEKFAIKNLLDKEFMHLSSGQMQLFNVVRSLIKEPDYLFLDEPTTSLDQSKSGILIDVLTNIIKEKQIPTLWCSHNYSELLRTCNKFWSINQNNIKIHDYLDVQKTTECMSNYHVEIYKSEFNRISKQLSIYIHRESEETVTISQAKNLNTISSFLRIISDNNVNILSIENINQQFTDMS